MKTTDTPRTDAAACDVDTYAGEYQIQPHPPVKSMSGGKDDPGGEWVPADFARELERENNLLLEIEYPPLNDQPQQP